LTDSYDSETKRKLQHITQEHSLKLAAIYRHVETKKLKFSDI